MCNTDASEVSLYVDIFTASNCISFQYICYWCVRIVSLCGYLLYLAKFSLSLMPSLPCRHTICVLLPVFVAMYTPPVFMEFPRSRGQYRSRQVCFPLKHKTYFVQNQASTNPFLLKINKLKTACTLICYSSKEIAVKIGIS